jgi:hypothetical protein
MKIRHKQLSFWSQFKVVAVAGLFAAVVVGLAIFTLERTGMLPSRSGRVMTTGIALGASVLLGVGLAAFFTLCQLAGLWLLRLLPWRGPVLDVSGEPQVNRIFE